MNHFPQYALSIRQPWAWLIVNGHKDVENREWFTQFRGPVAIHASKTMTRDDYLACTVFVAGIHDRLKDRSWRIPAPDQLQRGGIVGTAEIVACHSFGHVNGTDSPWFVGEYGFDLRHAKAVPFTPLNGKLGFFRLPADFKLSASPGSPALDPGASATSAEIGGAGLLQR